MYRDILEADIAKFEELIRTAQEEEVRLRLAGRLMRCRKLLERLRRSDAMQERAGASR